MYKDLFENKRNPVIDTGSHRIRFIGDPHIGRIFRTGVKSSLLGVREEMVLKQFRSLLEDDSDICVIIGDLFDKFIVSPSVIISVFNILKDVSSTNTNKRIYIIPGNHDLSRDKTKYSSYHLLSVMVSELSNVEMINEDPSYFQSGNIYFVLDAYNPFYEDEDNTSYQDKIDSILNSIPKGKTIIGVGHWDDVRFNHGYLPNSSLVNRSDLLLSGHIHLPFRTKYLNTKMAYIGSMQPYTFAEDDREELYITIKHSDLDKIFEVKTDKYGVPLEQEDPALRFQNKCVRINCYKSYICPYDLKCLSLVYNPIYSDPNKSIESQLETKDENTLLDFKTIFMNNIDKSGLELEDSWRQELDLILSGSKDTIEFQHVIKEKEDDSES